MIMINFFIYSILESWTGPCPDSHFRCPGEDQYCLPVYLRCNNVPDCIGKEDEMYCDEFACIGYYR